MKNRPNVLGVIPARGGSKGVPRKNIAVLNNKPLIAYTIESALNSNLLTDFVVSTDDEEIREVAKRFGAKVPFIRPSKLATDDAPSIPVIQHAVSYMEKAESIQYDLIMMLQPTTPFRIAIDIDSSIENLLSSGADSLVSVVDVEGHHPFRMKRIIGGNKLINYIDQGFEDMRPRQSLPKVYLRSGAIYLATRELVMSGHSFVGDNCQAYEMPNERAVNIDTQIDFLLADLLIKRK
jgi:CMP-N,N'-diacetyllegionaminic acid synthase